MPYHLYFYTLSHEAMRQMPTEPASVRAYIQARGEELGTLEFHAGESILFLSAVEDLTGEELMDLIQAPVGESEPTDQDSFGGMDSADIQRTLDALDVLLDTVDEQTSGVSALAETHDLSPSRLMTLLKNLRGLLQAAQEAGGELVTFYR